MSEQKIDAELPKPYREAVYANSSNTKSVRSGHEMSGYLKTPALYTAEQMREYAQRQAALTQPKAGDVVPEADEDAYVIEQMGQLLAKIAVIVKGPEPALKKWSYHDLPELVSKAIAAPQPPEQVQSVPDGWITWLGGKRPVDFYTLVQVKWAHSPEITEELAGHINWRAPYNPISYRVANRGMSENVSFPQPEQVQQDADDFAANIIMAICEADEPSNEENTVTVDIKWLQGLIADDLKNYHPAQQPTAPGGEAVYQVCLGGAHNWYEVLPEVYHSAAQDRRRILYTKPQGEAVAQPELTVVINSYPESNGKRNWTALIRRVDPWGGLAGNCGGMTLARGEFWNRVAYAAEEAKFLLGMRDNEPWIMDYGDDIKTPEEWKGEEAGKPPRIPKSSAKEPA